MPILFFHGEIQFDHSKIVEYLKYKMPFQKVSGKFVCEFKLFCLYTTLKMFFALTTVAQSGKQICL
jgi:hypothetical protein